MLHIYKPHSTHAVNADADASMMLVLMPLMLMLTLMLLLLMLTFLLLMLMPSMLLIMLMLLVLLLLKLLRQLLLLMLLMVWMLMLLMLIMSMWMQLMLVLWWCWCCSNVLMLWCCLSCLFGSCVCWAARQRMQWHPLVQCLHALNLEMSLPTSFETFFCATINTKCQILKKHWDNQAMNNTHWIGRGAGQGRVELVLGPWSYQAGPWSYQSGPWSQFITHHLGPWSWKIIDTVQLAPQNLQASHSSLSLHDFLGQEFRSCS